MGLLRLLVMQRLLNKDVLEGRFHGNHENRHENYAGGSVLVLLMILVK